jgi:hypothetical protein
MSQQVGTDNQIPKPLSQMTKTEIEMQDFSWENIRGMAVVFGILILGVYAYGKLSKKK